MNIYADCIIHIYIDIEMYKICMKKNWEEYYKLTLYTSSCFFLNKKCGNFQKKE